MGTNYFGMVIRIIRYAIIKLFEVRLLEIILILLQVNFLQNMQNVETYLQMLELMISFNNGCLVVLPVL